MAALDPNDPPSIGGYRLLGRLGAGGMGRVFLGRSPGGRRVAVKVMHPTLVDQPGFRIRFRREVEAARAVSGAFTAPVIDADPDAAEPWLVTSYIAGPSLEDAVASQGPMREPQVLALAAGLAEALVSIHSAHLVHRDLKPSNVLLTEDGPRVIDFGIARLAEGSSLTMTGHFLGSPGFMSPEQINGEEIGPAGDVFSLGTVLAHAATGESPFGNGHPATVSYRIVHDTPSLDTIADPTLRALIADCLAKDPARRPTPRDLLVRCGTGAATRASTGGDHPKTTADRHGAASPGPVFGRNEGAVAGATHSAVPADSRVAAPRTPGPGPAPAVGHDGPVTTVPATVTPHKEPAESKRRVPARRTLLVSAGAATIGAVGIPLALISGHDATSSPAKGSAPARPTGPKPVGTWQLDERSGTVAADGSGTHNGIAYDVRWRTGDNGAARFNGVSSQIITHGPVLDTAPGHSFTVSAWAYLTDAGSFATIVSQGTSGSAFYLQYSGADDSWAFSRPGVRVPAAKPPVMNTWTHLVGVCDAATHRLHLYLDGTHQATGADSRPVTPPGPLIIGRATAGGRPADFFPGSIRNVQVFDRALSPDQVAALD